MTLGAPCISLSPQNSSFAAFFFFLDIFSPFKIVNTYVIVIKCQWKVFSWGQNVSFVKTQLSGMDVGREKRVFKTFFFDNSTAFPELRKSCKCNFEGCWRNVNGQRSVFEINRLLTLWTIPVHPRIEEEKYLSMNFLFNVFFKNILSGKFNEFRYFLILKLIMMFINYFWFLSEKPFSTNREMQSTHISLRFSQY